MQYIGRIAICCQEENVSYEYFVNNNNILIIKMSSSFSNVFYDKSAKTKKWIL